MGCFGRAPVLWRGFFLRFTSCSQMSLTHYSIHCSFACARRSHKQGEAAPAHPKLLGVLQAKPFRPHGWADGVLTAFVGLELLRETKAAWKHQPASACLVQKINIRLAQMKVICFFSPQRCKHSLCTWTLCSNYIFFASLNIPVPVLRFLRQAVSGELSGTAAGSRSGTPGCWRKAPGRVRRDFSQQ